MARIRNQQAMTAGRKGTMAKEICISSTPHETRLAILEDDQLAEIYYERENEYTLAGSIYNGRVTRVLPGMQSAFVDIGLERDAFLYVTDFLELEDPEESDEVEKAASTGSTQPPREVHAAERGGSRTEERTQRSGRRQEPRADRTSQERQPRDQRLVVEAATETAETAGLEAGSVTEAPAQVDKDSLEQGGKRWRGRRRRRGGRGSAEDAQESQAGTGASAGDDFEETSSSIAPEEIQASATPSYKPQSLPTTAPASSGGSHGQAAPAFVLPGESLSKYGGTTDETESKPAAKPAQPVRPFPALSRRVWLRLLCSGMEAGFSPVNRFRGIAAARRNRRLLPKPLQQKTHRQKVKPANRKRISRLNRSSLKRPTHTSSLQRKSMPPQVRLKPRKRPSLKQKPPSQMRRMLRRVTMLIRQRQPGFACSVWAGRKSQKSPQLLRRLPRLRRQRLRPYPRMHRALD